MYCVTKNGAARCAGHDTAIRLELRFLLSEVPGRAQEVGPERRYFESRRGVPLGDGSPRVDKANPARPVDCRRESRRVVSKGAYVVPRCSCICARKPGDSRASFHKFLPADVLPGITARRFTANPCWQNRVYGAGIYIWETRGRRDVPPGTESAVYAESDRNDFSMEAFMSRSFEVASCLRSSLNSNVTFEDSKNILTD